MTFFLLLWWQWKLIQMLSIWNCPEKKLLSELPHIPSFHGDWVEIELSNGDLTFSNSSKYNGILGWVLWPLEDPLQWALQRLDQLLNLKATSLNIVRRRRARGEVAGDYCYKSPGHICIKDPTKPANRFTI